jgi:ankyrin repeat protein
LNTLLNNKKILWHSITNDHYDLFVKKMFDYSSLIKQTNEKGETLLHIACLLGLIDKYYALINFGVEPTLTNEQNNLLHYASFSGKDNFLIVELVKSGILPIEKNIYGQTSMHFCSNEKICHYLNLWCYRNNIFIPDLTDQYGNNLAHGCMMAGKKNSALYWINNYPILDTQINQQGKTWKQIIPISIKESL